jgi:hypothetical protein
MARDELVTFGNGGPPYGGYCTDVCNHGAVIARFGGDIRSIECSWRDYSEYVRSAGWQAETSPYDRNGDFVAHMGTHNGVCPGFWWTATKRASMVLRIIEDGRVGELIRHHSAVDLIEAGKGGGVNQGDVVCLRYGGKDWMVKTAASGGTGCGQLYEPDFTGKVLRATEGGELPVGWLEMYRHGRRHSQVVWGETWRSKRPSEIVNLTGIFERGEVKIIESDK